MKSISDFFRYVYSRINDMSARDLTRTKVKHELLRVSVVYSAMIGKEDTVDEMRQTTLDELFREPSN